MFKFIVQRVISMLLVIIIVASATFFMMRLLPSGPFSREKKLPQQIINNLNARYHLDDPLWKQYIDYMGNLARFNLGPSFKYTDRTVNNIINDGFPVSATLGIVAVSYTHLRAHETDSYLVCRLLLEKKKINV